MVNSNKIKGRLAELGKSYKDVASALDIALPTVSQKINNTRPLTLDEAEKLYYLLELEPEEFINYFAYGIGCKLEYNYDKNEFNIIESLKQLERSNKIIAEKLVTIEKNYFERWVTAKELSEIMGCSVNNIYVKIRSGKIYATNKLGSLPRIPMSQFYKNEENKNELSIKERVFDYN